MSKAAKFAKPSKALALEFRPAAFVNAFALVLKPREAKRSVDGGRKMLCSAIIFDTEESLLEAGVPTRVIADATVDAGMMYRQLVTALEDDEILPGYIGQGEVTSYGTKPWIVKDLDEATEGRVREIWERMSA